MPWFFIFLIAIIVVGIVLLFYIARNAETLDPESGTVIIELYNGLSTGEVLGVQFYDENPRLNQSAVKKGTAFIIAQKEDDAYKRAKVLGDVKSLVQFNPRGDLRNRSSTITLQLPSKDAFFLRISGYDNMYLKTYYKQEGDIATTMLSGDKTEPHNYPKGVTRYHGDFIFLCTPA